MNVALGVFLLLMKEVVGRSEVIITVSNLTALELDLISNGVDSRAVEIIYSAASCNLKRDQELNTKLDKLIAPVEQLHVSINRVLNQLSRKSSDFSEPSGTLELIVKHRLIDDTNPEDVHVDVKLPREPNEAPAFTNVDEIEYLAMSSQLKEVDPELCRTYEVVKDLIHQGKARRHEILRIAVAKYDYQGLHSVSAFAKFYHDYVAKYYDERIKVMGLAKLLGDYASLISEVYFLEDALKLHSGTCGIESNSVRKKRNVMQSMIGSGSCTRRYGTWDADIADIDFLKNVPFRNSLRKTALSSLGSCSDTQSSWNGVIESASYRFAISAGFKQDVEACVKLAICPKKMAYDGSKCIKHDKPTEFTNVENFEMSVVSGRVAKGEIPEELLKLERDYCSIQGKVVFAGEQCSRPLKSVERFTLFSIQGTWMVTDRDVLIAYGQDVSNICFYDCSEGCPGGCMECKGDESYESVFGKWPSATCKCSYCQNCSDIYMQVGSAKVGVDAVMHVMWPVTIPVSSEPLVSCNGCKVACHGRHLKVERDVKFDIVHLCVEEVCRIIDSAETDFSYLIPADLLHVTEFRLMFIRSDGQGRTDLFVSCADSHSCHSLHCDVCLERFANPHCYKFVNWVLLTLSVSSLVFAIPLICLLYKVVMLLINFALIPAKVICRIAYALFKRCRRGSARMAYSTGNRINQFVNEEEEQNRVRVARPQVIQLSLVILFWLCASATACENVVSIDSKVVNCMPSFKGDIKCAINTVIEVPLSSIGEESCINVKEQTSGLVQIIKLKTTSVRQKCTKTILYYTGDNDFKLLNTFRCRSAGDCIDDVCEKIKSDGPVPVPSINTDKAGYHGCRRVTGFWGKGCFYASQACQFFKVELQNKLGRSYEVSKCSEWSWEVKVNISISSKDGSDNEELTLDTTLPQKSRIGTIQLTSINVPSTPSTDKCFMRRLSDKGKTAIVNCSPRNGPVVGKIGGIQCATPALAEKASKSCLVDPAAVHLVTQDDNVVFVNRFVNVTREWTENLLPSNLTNSVISEDDSGQVFIHYSSSASYVIRIRMEDYKVTYSISKATCEAHFRMLKGCSNCGTGAQLHLEIILTDATRAPVSVRCPSAPLPGLELVLASSPLTRFKMAFGKPEINEKCEVECPGNTIEIDVKGNLIGNIKIRDGLENSVISKGADFFSSIPWLNFGFTRYLFLVVGVFIAIPIFYVVFIGLSTCLKVILRRLTKRRPIHGKTI